MSGPGNMEDEGGLQDRFLRLSEFVNGNWIRLIILRE
jgi:hypothetical protein